jgi:hypothetical protein
MAINLHNYNSKFYDVFNFIDFISQEECDVLYEQSKNLYDKINGNLEPCVSNIRYNYALSSTEFIEKKGVYQGPLPQNFSFKDWMENTVYPNIGGQVITSIALTEEEEDIFGHNCTELCNQISEHYGGQKGKSEGAAIVVHCHKSWLSGHRDSADKTRLNVVLLYLTPYDIEGGELVVGNDDNKEVIKPTFGTGVVINLGFTNENDSPYHEVLPTTNGYRLSMTNFFNKVNFF